MNFLSRVKKDFLSGTKNFCNVLLLYVYSSLRLPFNFHQNLSIFRRQFANIRCQSSLSIHGIWKLSFSTLLQQLVRARASRHCFKLYLLRFVQHDFSLLLKLEIFSNNKKILWPIWSMVPRIHFSPLFLRISLH